MKFATDQTLGMWVPETMEEQYRGQSSFVTGQAKDSAYRQFRVDTSEAVK